MKTIILGQKLTVRGKGIALLQTTTADFKGERISKKRQSPKWQTMKATLVYKDDFLYVVEEKDAAVGRAKKWLPVRVAGYAEAQTLQGRPVTTVNIDEGIYVDE